MARPDKEARRLARQYVFDFLRKSICVDCGETHPACLEFDHVNPDEKFCSVSKLQHAGAPIAKIRREIQKCVVRCSNCHRKRTSTEQGWYSDLQGGSDATTGIL